MMLRQEDLQNLAGRDVYDRSDTKIGKAGQIYVDATSGEPEWLCVNTGLFGTSESFVPLRDAQLKGDDVYVAYDKGQVKDAPNIDPGTEGISAEQERRLYDYYSGLGWQEPQRGGTGQYGGTQETQSRGTQERQDSGTREPRGRGGDDAMTRSEERLRVDTQAERAGTARLRKYVTTEPVETTVQVRREEPRIEREPITDANRDAALTGPDLTESEHEVALQAERPVVDKETVPVERVRLTKDTVTEEQTVGDEVRKEQIDTDTPER
jgi:uncharacterized protein (TIGR02271 family)